MAGVRLDAWARTAAGRLVPHVVTVRRDGDDVQRAVAVRGPADAAELGADAAELLAAWADVDRALLVGACPCGCLGVRA